MGHGPDADDAFIFYAIKAGYLSLPDARVTHRTAPMDELNRLARAGALDVTAMSAACYPHVASAYAIMSCGGSMTVADGPLVVSRAPLDPARLRGMRIAVPGLETTSVLLLRLAVPDWEPVVVPYDAIAAGVAAGRFEAGLLIHEGQVTYVNWGLAPVLDLAHWWRDATGLPLPLALNVAARRLGAERIDALVRLLRESVDWAFAHADEAVGYARGFAGGLDAAETLALAHTFINEHSVEMSAAGRAALRELFDRGAAAGLCPPVAALDII